MVANQIQTPQNTMGTGSSNYTQIASGMPQTSYMQNMQPGPANPQLQQQLRQQQQQRLMAMKRQQSMSNPGQQPQQQPNAALMAQIQQQMPPTQYQNYPSQQRFQ